MAETPGVDDMANGDENVASEIGTSSSMNAESEVNALAQCLRETGITDPWEHSIYDPGAIMREMKWDPVEETTKEAKIIKQSQDIKEVVKEVLELRENWRKSKEDWMEGSVMVLQIVATTSYKATPFAAALTDDESQIKSFSEFFEWFQRKGSPSGPRSPSGSFTTASFDLDSLKISNMLYEPVTFFKVWAMSRKLWDSEKQRDAMLALTDTDSNLYNVYKLQILESWKNEQGDDKGPLEPRSLRCRQAREKCKCDNMEINAESFLGFPIQDEFTCTSACLIYAGVCQNEECKAIYIGETKRPLCERMREHQTTKSQTHVGKHLRTNDGHTVKFTGLVYASPEQYERKALEKAFIEVVKEHKQHTLFKGRELLNKQNTTIGDCQRQGCPLCNRQQDQ